MVKKIVRSHVKRVTARRLAQLSVESERRVAAEITGGAVRARIVGQRQNPALKSRPLCMLEDQQVKESGEEERPAYLSSFCSFVASRLLEEILNLFEAPLHSQTKI